MKKIFLILVIGTVFNHALDLATYTTSRFSIDYPSEILVNKLYEYNDSIAFSNKEENVKLFVSGSKVSLDLDANGVYGHEIPLIPNRASRRNEEVEITYKAQKDNWYVISGYNHTKKTIFYTKGLVYKKEKYNLLIEYVFRYPIKEKEKYGKLIKIFNQSFIYPYGKSVFYKERQELSFQNDIGSLGNGLIQVFKESFKWKKRNDQIEIVNTSNLKPFMTPIFYKPDYGVCYFIFEKEEAGFYVGLSADGKKVKIKKEKGINLLTWNKFLTDEITGISEEHSIEYMYKEANKQSEKIKIKDFDKSEILEVKGFWMKIKNKDDTGWIEWRDEKNLLILVSLLC